MQNLFQKYFLKYFLMTYTYLSFEIVITFLR